MAGCTHTPMAQAAPLRGASAAGSLRGGCGDADDAAAEDALREMFEEPAAFFEPPPPPGSASYRRPSNGQLVQLVTAGRSPLWGHIVWNAGRVMADYIEGNPAIVLGKSVLELGAGAALPAIVAALNGAKCVTITDYPDGDLVESMTQNVAQNISPSSNCVVHVRGYKVCHKFSKVSCRLDLMESIY